MPTSAPDSHLCNYGVMRLEAISLSLSMVGDAAHTQSIFVGTMICGLEKGARDPCAVLPHAPWWPWHRKSQQQLFPVWRGAFHTRTFKRSTVP
eukprot:1175586-Amphidinium_carterae.1